MSEEVEPHPEWNEGLEMVVKKEGEQSESLYWLHLHAANWASKRNDWIQIPAILLATVTGFFSATSDMIPPIAIGAMSILVGALNTINSYYKFSQRAEGHRIASHLYLQTYKNIEVELSLPIEQRTAAEQLLKDLRDRMGRVSETAPPLPAASIAAYAAKFKEHKTSVPIIANGLSPIEIHRAPPRLATPRPPAPSSPTIEKSPIRISVAV